MQWSGRRYDTGECMAITVEDGIIRKVEPIDEQPQLPWISPGWIDLQVNGFAGFDLNDRTTVAEDILGVTKAMFSCGVTNYLPTVITGSSERISQAMQAIRNACEQNDQVKRSILGIHLEGPYLSSEDGPRGAHEIEFIRDPDAAEFASWQQAAGGKITLVTLAPERKGAIPFIRKLVSEGVVVSIGHTMAGSERLEEAVAAGASMSTHLGNGSHPILPRHPNYIWDQLANDGLQAMLIADGHHLPSNVLKVIMRVKRDQFILVSDCVKFGGMMPGIYRFLHGERVELLANGRLQLADNPAFMAGSAQSLDRGVENAVRLAGISLKEAIDAVTVRPAEAMRFHGLGKLKVGAEGNLTLFDMDHDGKIKVCETVLSGQSVFQFKG